MLEVTGLQRALGFRWTTVNWGGLISTGAIDFISSGAVGSGNGAIQLFFLISIPQFADIDLQEIRSSLSANDAGNGFSLSLFSSDARGAKTGSALLELTGNTFDEEAVFHSGQGYDLLQLDATARATAGSSSNVTSFSLMIDLTPATVVPEPAATSLLVLGGVLLALVRQRRYADLRR